LRYLCYKAENGIRVRLVTEVQTCALPICVDDRRLRDANRRFLRQRLTFPLIVKSLTQEASIGISQASVVDTDEKLKERVTFIHESIGTAAIVEQYVEGRELYVGILGNQSLQAMPVWELFFTNMPEGAKRIATDRVKWSVKYQKKYGIDSGPAKDL